MCSSSGPSSFGWSKAVAWLISNCSRIVLTCNSWSLINHHVSVPRLTGIRLTRPFQKQFFDEKCCCFTFKHLNYYEQQFASKMLQYRRQQIPFTQAVIAFMFMFHLGQVGYTTSCFSRILSLVFSSRFHHQKRASLTYVTKIITNTHVGILIYNMPANPDKETSPAFTSCVLEHHSQGHTAHMISHKHVSVANPDSHSSRENFLPTKILEGSQGNFNKKHENNGSKVTKGP